MALSDRPWGPVVANGTSTATSQSGLNQIALAVGPLPATLTLTSATETQVPNPGQLTIPLSVAVHPDEAYEQCVFDLFASGIITTGTTTNVTIKLYSGASATIGSNTLLGSSGAVAQNGTTGARVTAAWFAQAKLIYDSVSGTLAGTISFYVNKTVVATVTLSNFPTGFLNVGNPSANPPTVSNLPQFTLTFASSGATTATNAQTFVNVQKFSCG
jgi:hypothetical protein